jgi:hypothetical protein
MKIYFLPALAILFSGVVHAQEPATVTPRGEYKWAVTACYGKLTSDPLSDVLTFNADFESDYKFWVLALTRKIMTVNPKLTIEAEGQIAKHTEGQDHWEINGLFAARWLRFPWDAYVDTTVAAGAGLSYASELPPFEVATEGDSDKLLGYLMLELTGGPPSIPQWDLVTRIHHRSGAGKILGSDVEGASNSITLGLKYRF